MQTVDEYNNKKYYNEMNCTLSRQSVLSHLRAREERQKNVIKVYADANWVLLAFIFIFIFSIEKISKHEKCMQCNERANGQATNIFLP